MSFTSPLEWYWVIAPLAVAALAVLLILRGLFHLGRARFAPAGVQTAGGLVLGLLEQFSAGYLSSQYKDAVAFIVILLVLFTMPQGLFGAKSVERV